MAEWTIQKLLSWISDYFTQKGLDSPRLRAEMLLSEVLGRRRIELYTHFNEVVDKYHLDRLHELVARAGRGEPIAYLIGKTEFYSLQFEVSRQCMIPREETELLVAKAIDFLRSRQGRQYACDLCTGSGCVAVAIAKNVPDAEIVATDISAGALSIADSNVRRHQLQQRIRLLQGDLFEALIPPLEPNQFDLVVANPPYVSQAEYENLETNVRDYEPADALLGGTDGLDVHRKIIEQAPRFIKDGGALMLEIGYTQGQAVRKLLEGSRAFRDVAVVKDLTKHDRVVTAIRAEMG